MNAPAEDSLTRSADGEFMMVPKEATLDMLNAGWRQAAEDGHDVESIELAPIYRAMLSVAPQQHGREVVGTPYRCDYCGADYGVRACCEMRYEYLRKFGENILPPISAQQPAEVVAVDEVQKWKDRYFDRRRVISQWHNEAVALGYDGVADLLACVERGEPPIHIAELLARTAPRTTQPPAIDIGKLREVTDSMVHRACEAHYPLYDRCGDDTRAGMQASMRRVLMAALIDSEEVKE